MTQKGTIIFKRFTAGKKLMKCCKLRKKSILGIIFLPFNFDNCFRYYFILSSLLNQYVLFVPLQ